MESKFKIRKLKVGDKVIPNVPGSKPKIIRAEVDDERVQLSDGSLWLKSNLELVTEWKREIYIKNNKEK